MIGAIQQCGVSGDDNVAEKRKSLDDGLKSGCVPPDGAGIQTLTDMGGEYSTPAHVFFKSEEHLLRPRFIKCGKDQIKGFARATFRIGTISGGKPRDIPNHTVISENKGASPQNFLQSNQYVEAVDRKGPARKLI